MLNEMEYNQIHEKITKFLKEMHHPGIEEWQDKIKRGPRAPGFYSHLKEAEKVTHPANRGDF